MVLKDELMIGKPLAPAMELMLALMFTRERVARLLDTQLFGPAGITEPQFNVLRILKGGPPEGYPIREIKARMITPNADVPRLVDRMGIQGWVMREVHPEDARSCRVSITKAGLAAVDQVSPELEALAKRVAKVLNRAEQKQLMEMLDRLRAQVEVL
jgi:DNA-binding MarR family transcriptional regulator